MRHRDRDVEWTEFEELVRTSYGPLRAYALRRLDDMSSVDDLISDTYLIAWKKRRQIPSGTAQLPWLYAVERRVLSNLLRSKQRRYQLVTRLALTREATSDEEEAIDLRYAVAAALDRMDEDDRDLLQMATWEQLSHQEIGMVLNCTPNAVAVRLHRARQRLEGLLDVSKETTE